MLLVVCCEELHPLAAPDLAVKVGVGVVVQRAGGPGGTEPGGPHVQAAHVERRLPHPFLQTGYQGKQILLCKAHPWRDPVLAGMVMHVVQEVPQSHLGIWLEAARDGGWAAWHMEIPVVTTSYGDFDRYDGVAMFTRQVLRGPSARRPLLHRPPQYKGDSGGFRERPPSRSHVIEHRHRRCWHPLRGWLLSSALCRKPHGIE
mmetsp:Transcript_9962/g.29901  ORF Transcript_9962/g.29901 Transcript_9962/m.29901 type:complete len:202 (-) Transcript_9962:557-1162(-)